MPTKIKCPWTAEEYAEFDKLAESFTEYKPEGFPGSHAADGEKKFIPYEGWPHLWKSDPRFKEFRTLRTRVIGHLVAKRVKSRNAYRTAYKLLMQKSESYFFRDVLFLIIVAGSVNDYYRSREQDPSHVTGNRALRHRQVKTMARALQGALKGAGLVDLEQERAGQQYMRNVIRELSADSDKKYARKTYLQRKFSTNLAMLLHSYFEIDSPPLLRALCSIIGYAPKALTTLANHTTQGKEDEAAALKAMGIWFPLHGKLEGRILPGTEGGLAGDEEKPAQHIGDSETQP